MPEGWCKSALLTGFLILDSLTLPSFFSILFMVISCLYTLSLSFPFAVRSFSISFLCSLILFIKFVTLDWSPAPLLLRLEISHFSSASFLFQGRNQRKKNRLNFLDWMYHGTAHTQKLKPTQWYSPLLWLASVNLLHRYIRICVL